MLLNRAQPLWLVCVSAVLLSGLGIARAEEKPCTTHADGNYYDLSRLKLASNDYEFKSYGGKDYILNVCRPVRQEVWAPKVDKPEDVAGFTHRSHGDFSLGDVNTTVVVHGGHPLIYMTDGTRCPNAGDMTASTVIRFVCDASAGTGKPQLIATLPPDEEQACSFFVEWRSEIACPTAEGSLFGTIVSVLAIIVAVLFALYIVGGTLYNRYVLELQGMDQIPRFSFFSFSDTVEFVRECMERVRDKSSDAWQSRNWGTQDWGRGGSWSSSGRQGYSGLHASAEEAQTMLSGPPGFLDEQDEEDEEAPVPPAHPENGRAPGMDANGVIRL
ncbi:mannose 6-phosphate receptor domain-containing protein [Lentinus tigrinus ALCF2SS1-7]|uniref:mannose 6-phosphate receptor domain-containing protein n=1 Tax=Lentinus tigrinus ALCF2SS1-7 TaxID=1328758 RepID=UPI001165E7D8|nr:mannose 6-phosphate receptor domain-containing protein [Lentinus tigrinus ALCF2SS1-7]